MLSNDGKCLIPQRLQIPCLTLMGFLVRLYMAHIDPFLHIWDERFHVLVARNMMTAPFHPVLRNNALFPSEFHNWTQASLWLHKPPLFMWQMALSMKLFGANEYAARYPSVVMGTLMIPMLYFIILEISKNSRIAFLTAALFCFSNFHLELVSGIRSMDHNDLALEFYVLASVWAFFKYQKQQKWYWLLLIGVFSGAAILCKWLIGLFVFLLWGLQIMFQLRNRKTIKDIGRLLLALIVCCCVFLPWQWYIFHYFPKEAAFEYDFNTRHITEVVEAHGGTVFFYLERFPALFGEGLFLLIFPGLFLFLKTKEGKQVVAKAVLSSLLFVLLFFSVIVKTKVISHVYFIAPLVMMLIAYSIIYLMPFVRRRFLKILVLAGVFMLNTKPEKILLYQYVNNEQLLKDIHNAEVYKVVGQKIPADVKAVINIPDWVSLLFYNKKITAYETLSPEQINTLKAQKIKIAAFSNVAGHPLPEYIADYPYLVLLNDRIE